jgi:hypothetical protein
LTGNNKNKQKVKKPFIVRFSGIGRWPSWWVYKKTPRIKFVSIKTKQKCEIEESKKERKRKKKIAAKKTFSCRMSLFIVVRRFRIQR